MCSLRSKKSVKTQRRKFWHNGSTETVDASEIQENDMKKKWKKMKKKNIYEKKYFSLIAIVSLQI